MRKRHIVFTQSVPFHSSFDIVNACIIGYIGSICLGSINESWSPHHIKGKYHLYVFQMKMKPSFSVPVKTKKQHSSWVYV